MLGDWLVVREETHRATGPSENRLKPECGLSRPMVAIGLVGDRLGYQARHPETGDCQNEGQYGHRVAKRATMPQAAKPLVESNGIQRRLASDTFDVVVVATCTNNIVCISVGIIGCGTNVIQRRK